MLSRKYYPQALLVEIVQVPIDKVESDYRDYWSELRGADLFRVNTISHPYGQLSWSIPDFSLERTILPGTSTDQGHINFLIVEENSISGDISGFRAFRDPYLANRNHIDPDSNLNSNGLIEAIKENRYSKINYASHSNITSMNK